MSIFDYLYLHDTCLDPPSRFLQSKNNAQVLQEWINVQIAQMGLQQFAITNLDGEGGDGTCDADDLQSTELKVPDMEEAAPFHDSSLRSSEIISHPTVQDMNDCEDFGLVSDVDSQMIEQRMQGNEGIISPRELEKQATIGSVHGDILTVPKDSLTLRDQTPALRDDTSTLRDDTLTLRDDTPTIYKDSSTVRDNTGLISDPVRVLQVSPSAETPANDLECNLSLLGSDAKGAIISSESSTMPLQAGGSSLSLKCRQSDDMETSSLSTLTDEEDHNSDMDLEFEPVTHLLEEEAVSSDEDIIHSEPEVGDLETEVVESEQEDVDSESDLIESEPEVVESEQEDVDLESDIIESEPEVVESDSDEVGLEPNEVEPEEETVGLESDNVDSEPDVAESEPEVVESESEVVEMESDYDDSEPDDTYSEDADFEEDIHSCPTGDANSVHDCSESMSDQERFHHMPSVTSWEVMTADNFEATHGHVPANRRGPSEHPIRSDLRSSFLTWDAIRKELGTLESCNFSFRSSMAANNNSRSRGTVIAMQPWCQSLVDLDAKFVGISDISNTISRDSLNSSLSASLSQLSTICQLMRTCSVQLLAVQRQAQITERFYRTRMTQLYLHLYRWLVDFGPNLASHLWTSCEKGVNLGHEYKSLSGIVMSIYQFVRDQRKIDERKLLLPTAKVEPLMLSGTAYTVELELRNIGCTSREAFQELFMQAIYIIVLRPSLPSGSIALKNVFQEQDFLMVVTNVCNAFFRCFRSLVFALPSKWGVILKNPRKLYQRVNGRKPVLGRLSHALRIHGDAGLQSLVYGLSEMLSSVTIPNFQVVSPSLTFTIFVVLDSKFSSTINHISRTRL